MTTHFARATRLWRGQRWMPDALLAFDHDGIWLASESDAAGREIGVLAANVLPPLTDAHVHLGLSDFAERGGGVLARVLDLGWDPPALESLAASHRQTEVAFAGRFLTAPGGYPSTRAWAPEGSVTQVADETEAVRAIDDAHGLGACVVKVALNADAGPVFPDDVLRTIVDRAHDLDLRVVAHVEGAGQPQRAALAGVDAFAHAPWTHRLTDGELTAMAGGVRWISTLDMHGRGHYGDDYATALDNLTRFAALGGTVVYGTDLGNDMSRTDLNPREVAALRDAGLDAVALIAAMTASGLLPSLSGSGRDRAPATVTLLPEEVVHPEDMVDVLPESRPVHATALKELLR
jgi:imidazolonepropionase-like amidohydrolase